MGQEHEMKGVVTTGSISSTVELDDHGTADKTYKPPLFVRLLYWLVFQVPFPYVANHAALEAARYRRLIVGLLTEFWYGDNFVAPVLDIHDESDGSHARCAPETRLTAEGGALRIRSPPPLDGEGASEPQSSMGRHP